MVSIHSEKKYLCTYCVQTLGFGGAVVRKVEEFFCSHCLVGEAFKKLYAV